MASSARLILAGGPFGGQEVDLLPADHAPPAQIVWSGWVGGFTAALYEWHGETTMDGGRADALIYRPTGRHLTPDEIPPLVAEVADLWATTPHRF